MTTYPIALIHKFEEPVTRQLARVPVRGDYIDHQGGFVEVKRVLLHPTTASLRAATVATVWVEPADFPLPYPTKG